MPLLNLRLARPYALIDINGIDELHSLRDDEDGLTIGATIRQREVEKLTGLANTNPLLAEALPLIGHFQTRGRGTICGSLAFADPGAELPAVAVTQEAKFTIQSQRGQRIVTGRDFFKKRHTTIMEHDEMLTHVTFPPWKAGDGWAFEEVGRRPGDFAIAGVAVLLTPANGRCGRARITVFGTPDIPQRSESAETLLAGNSLSAGLMNEIVARVQAETSTWSDLHATAEYRRHVIGVLVRRAVLLAAKRAGLLAEGFNG